MSRMERMRIRPAKRLVGEIELPGDKSISHRSAILGAMATGATRIENYSDAADCQTTLRCLEQLGVKVERDQRDVVIHGVGKTGFRASERPIDCGNSGTTARTLAGLLAGQGFDSVLKGDASLTARPMERVIDPLCRMGAKIDSPNGRLPMTICGGQRLRGMEHDMTVASAQVKSCLLIAGLLADGTTKIVEPVPTRDHTERMLRWFGAEVSATQAGEARVISVTPVAELTARDIIIPADISSAAYFMAAAALLPGSNVSITGVGLNPLRNGIIDVLRDAGAELRVVNVGELCNEPVGTVRVTAMLDQGNSSETVRLSGAVIPVIIDELPILAVFGTGLRGGIEVRGATELRAKETDRISAVVQNLRRMGAEVEEFDDGFRVSRSMLRGASIDSFGDHRIAMAFSVAALIATGETEIGGSECVDISFPDFFDVLERSVERIDG